MQAFLWNLWRRNALPFLRDSFIHHCRYAISHSAMFLNNKVLKFTFLLCSHLRLGRPLRFFLCFSRPVLYEFYIYPTVFTFCFHLIYLYWITLTLLHEENNLWYLDNIISSIAYYSPFCSKCSSWPSFSKAINKIINAITIRRPT